MAKKPPRWTWLKRGLVTALVLANVIIGYALWQVNRVGDALAEFETDTAVEAVLSEPPADPADPVTFLILGSDSRENLPDEWVGDFGDFGGQRADVIMLAKVYPEAGKVELLSLPRDLRSEIEGFGTQKINAAYAFGGAALMVSTVRAELGIAIHHYVEIDFVGFAGLVDQLGGLPVSFLYPARDLKSGLNVAEGDQILDGRMALSYARSRSYQELRDGRWVSADADDIGRTRRQQQLLIGILGQLKKPANIVGVQSLVSELAEFMVVDPDFVNLDLLSLALAFRDFGGGDIVASTLPTFTEIIGGLYFEVRDEPAATDALAAFAGQAPQAVATTTVPRVITLQVANGNGAPGIAAQWATTLTELGFDVLAIVDYDSFGVSTTQIVSLTGSGYGELVYESLGFGELVAGDPGSSDVMIILGTDSVDRPG